MHKRTGWLRARTKSSPEYTRNNDSDLKSGAPDVLLLSDSSGQVSLVDKQISRDAANLPVLTNWKYDGTAMFCNMWYVSVKWKVCHTPVSLQKHATAEKPACAIFYTSVTHMPQAIQRSNVIQHAAVHKGGMLVVVWLYLASCI